MRRWNEKGGPKPARGPARGGAPRCPAVGRLTAGSRGRHGPGSGSGRSHGQAEPGGVIETGRADGHCRPGRRGVNGTVGGSGRRVRPAGRSGSGDGIGGGPDRQAAPAALPTVGKRPSPAGTAADGRRYDPGDRTHRTRSPPPPRHAPAPSRPFFVVPPGGRPPVRPAGRRRRLVRLRPVGPGADRPAAGRAALGPGRAGGAAVRRGRLRRGRAGGRRGPPRQRAEPPGPLLPRQREGGDGPAPGRRGHAPGRHRRRPGGDQPRRPDEQQVLPCRTSTA